MKYGSDITLKWQRHTTSLPIWLVCLQCDVVRGSLGKVSWVVKSHTRSLCGFRQVASLLWALVSSSIKLGDRIGWPSCFFTGLKFSDSSISLFVHFPLILFQSGKRNRKTERQDNNKKRELFNKHQTSTKHCRLSTRILFKRNNNCRKHIVLLLPFYRCGPRGYNLFKVAQLERGQVDHSNPSLGDLGMHVFSYVHFPTTRHHVPGWVGKEGDKGRLGEREEEMWAAERSEERRVM